jgi:hypothetical protein
MSYATFCVTAKPNGETSIKCNLCGCRSHDPKDVENQFCANCHTFHAELPPDFMEQRRITQRGALQTLSNGKMGQTR